MANSLHFFSTGHSRSVDPQGSTAPGDTTEKSQREQMFSARFELTLNTKIAKAAWAAGSFLRARVAHGFAAVLTGAFEAIPIVAGGEPIISRLVLTRLVLISAHTRKIDANKHMTANKPV